MQDRNKTIRVNQRHSNFKTTGSPGYEQLESRTLLAGIIGADAYSPASIADPFVANAVTYEQMVQRAAFNHYLAGELVVAISANKQGAAFDVYLNSINWQQSFGLQPLQDVGIESVRTMMTVERGSTSIALVHLQLGATTDIFAAMQHLETNDAVLWSSPNFYQTGDQREFTPNDPQYASQYHHTLMRNNLAWDLTLGDSSIIIGITDDGFSLAHQDLASNIYVNPDEVAGDGVDNDNNGYIDDVNGWDFISNNNNANPNNTGDSHGTHVAGIAAARTDNLVGVAGTAGRSTILPLQFYSSTAAWPASVINSAYRYAADNGARIVSTSYNINGWVGDPVFTAGMQYMYDAGVLSLNSAGNSAELNPIRQNFHQTILVASSDSGDVLSSFSNYGTGIDIVAPGSSILSTLPSNTYGPNSGTSMSTPNAAGAAALIWSAHPTWTRDQVAAQLVGTGDSINAQNPTRVGLMGGGRVNSFRGITETLAAPQVRSITGMPAQGEYRNDPTISTFTLRFDEIMDPASINNGANFQLRSAGLDEILGNSDDVIHPLTYNNYKISTNELVFNIADGPMNYGHYRFTIVSDGVQNPFGTGLDGNGNGTGGDNYVREFHIAAPVVGEVSFNANGYLLVDTIGVSVIDGNAAATIQVVVTTPRGDTETLTFNRNGSTYAGTIPSIGGSVATNDGRLQVALGEVITVAYLDLNNGSGGTLTVTDTAVINNVKEYPATDTPKAITDNSTTVSTITITDTGILLDADLRLNVTHTWVGDLDATLTAPNGTVFVMFNRIGGSGDNFQVTYFDDSAATPIAAGTAPYNGSFRPQDPFAPINGISITGNWVLRIRDNASQDVGTLNAWSLFLNVQPVNTVIGSVIDTNAAPNTVAENASVGSLTSITATAIDPDAGDSVSYSLTNSAGGRFAINSTTGVVTVAGILDYETAVSHSIGVRATSSDSSFSDATFLIAVTNVNDAIVSTRQIFYQGSSFDTSNDFDAVATDKQYLSPGRTATFANYSSYWLGLNGLVLEVNDFNGTPTLANLGSYFSFKVGNDDTPGDWTTATTPSGVSFQSNVNANGIDRVFLTWADNAIRNTWLQVVVLPGSTTGLAAPDVFYFGSVVGETGNDPANARVNLQDVGATRANQTGFGSATIENDYDFNRDGRVNLADIAIVRQNQSGFSSVNLITPGSGKRSPIGGAMRGGNDKSPANNLVFGGMGDNANEQRILNQSDPQKQQSSPRPADALLLTIAGWDETNSAGAKSVEMERSTNSNGRVGVANFATTKQSQLYSSLDRLFEKLELQSI